MTVPTSITDESIERLRELIGVEFPTNGTEDATPFAIRRWCDGVGDDNPLYTDPDHASRTRFGTLVAPPTFLYSCQSGKPRRLTATGSTMGLPKVFGMWSRDSWQWYEPILAGDHIHGTESLEGVRERTEGQFTERAVIQTILKKFYNQHDKLVGEYRKNITQFDRRPDRKHAPPGRHPYTKDEIKRIREQYEAEPGMRRGSTPRYWEDVQVGEAVGPMVKGPLTITTMLGWTLGYGSTLAMTNRLMHQHLRDNPADELINEETNVYDSLTARHYDEHLAAQAGLPGPYDVGGMRGSWCGHFLTDWMGDDADLIALDMKLVRPNIMGDTTWINGKVSSKFPDGVVECSIECTNQREEPTAIATGRVRLPLKESATD